MLSFKWQPRHEARIVAHGHTTPVGEVCIVQPSAEVVLPLALSRIIQQSLDAAESGAVVASHRAVTIRGDAEAASQHSYS